ncbi:MAG TPA: hypothetical protein H9798_07850 [Candidatus Mediterraneibacter pullicola]|uniref:DUF2178 domain-containing protein n=1 Tax=Candidatus Mediterraneibacter pullicola TaxID=2838682 RepID=A0A9D2KIQ1_9FIRM|nr:hypothetical protein [Candidatus Mediterraneibacter pullicola]
MLLKMMMQEAKTDGEFRKKLEIRIKMTWVSVLMGVVAVVSGVAMMMLGADEHRTAFLSGVYCGIGTVAIVGGIISVVRTHRMLNDEKLLRSERIKESDERENAICKNAASSAGTALVYLMFAALIVAGFFSMTVFWTLWGTLIGYFLILKGMKVYYQKKN